jgi:catechol-2,3-dioxygenase
MGYEDPDGCTVRLYVDDKHEWTYHSDQDEYWLGTVQAGPHA